MSEYIYNNVRPSKQEISLHDEIIRDTLAGDERMRLRASQYVRRPDMMKAQDWTRYLKGATFVNVPAHSLRTWLGACNRKQHVIECPVPVDFRLGHMRLDANALAKHALASVLSMGRVVYVVDPMGFIVQYQPHDEVEIKVDAGMIIRATFQEDDDLRICYHMQDGVARFQYMDNAGTISQEGDLIVSGKTIGHLPIVCLNAFDCSTDRALSPLVDICKLAVNYWDLSLCQASALWWTGNPQPYAVGIQNEKEVPVAIGPQHVLAFTSENAKFGFATYSGSGISDRRDELRRLEANMSAMGAFLMLSRTDAYTVAKTREMTNRGSTADLVEIIRNVDSGLEILLRHLVEFKGGDVNAVKVNLNKDLLDATAESNMVRALNESYNLGLLSFSTWHQIMKGMEIVPESVNTDDEKERVNEDVTLVRGQAAKDSILDGGDGYPDGEDHAVVQDA